MSSGSAARANKGGVFFGELNSLAPATVGTSPVTIDTGAAIVFGSIYENTASVNVAIPTPAGATRIDRIVLRKSWSAQTVRITRIAGAEGGAAPAMTQTEGVTWDIPLAQATITTGGAVTVSDSRENVFFVSGSVPSQILFDVAGTSGANNVGASSAGHVHQLGTPAIPSTQAFNDLADTGTGNDPAREDHKHAMPKVHRAYKTADALATGLLDAQLQAPVLAGEIYTFDGTIMYTDASLANIGLTISIPIGSTLSYSAIGADPADPTQTKVLVSLSALTQLEFAASAVAKGIHYRGTVAIGNAGNFGIIIQPITPLILKFSNLGMTKVN